MIEITIGAIIVSIIAVIGAFFAGPRLDAIIEAKKEIFKDKFTKEIFDELENFTDDEKEKLLFLIRDKIKEKRKNVKKFFNDE